MKCSDVRDLPPGKKLYDHYVKGLFALGNRNGSKTFYLYYYDMSGKQRKIKLGLYGQLTLEGARKSAQDLLSRVAAGENPAMDKAAFRNEMTVYDLMKMALKEYWGIERFINSGQFKNVISAVRNYFQKIGRYKLSELTVKIVNDWHKSYARIPCQANLSLTYLMTAINWAIKNDLTKIKNPCPLVKKFPRRRRSRYATPEEIKKIGAFLEQEFPKNPFQSIYLYLILTTGTRPSAVERLLWHDLKTRKNACDEEVGVISFYGKSTARTGERETIIIPPKTLKMIKMLPRIDEHIVPCKMPVKLWQKIKKRFNCKDLWARDLRRTFATVGLSSGKISLSQIGELLNHKCSETTKAYAKLMMAERIESTMEIAKSLDAIIHR